MKELEKKALGELEDMIFHSDNAPWDENHMDTIYRFYCGNTDWRPDLCEYVRQASFEEFKNLVEKAKKSIQDATIE